MGSERHVLAWALAGAASFWGTPGCGPARPGASTSPVNVSISPDSGTGKDQVFILTYSDPGGHANLRDVRVLFNAGLDGRAACYVYFSPPDRALRLVNDAGNGSNRTVAGSVETLENSQCMVRAGESTASGTGEVLKLTLSLTFKPNFDGVRNIYIYAANTQGLETGLLWRGRWTVPGTFVRSTSR